MRGAVLALVALCFALGFIPLAKSHPAGNSCHAHLFGGDSDPHSEPIPGCIKTSGVIILARSVFGPQPALAVLRVDREGRRELERRKLERQRSAPQANEPGKNRVRRLWD